MKMREIKFKAVYHNNRGKTRLSKSFTFGDLRCRDTERYGEEIYLDNGGFQEIAIDKNTKLVQYTGIKDKNGKEIYEGDILKFEGKKGIIDFKNGSYVAITEWEEFEGNLVHGSLWEGKELITFFDDEFEVIGNIYENLELLK